MGEANCSVHKHFRLYSLANRNYCTHDTTQQVTVQQLRYSAKTLKSWRIANSMKEKKSEFTLSEFTEMWRGGGGSVSGTRLPLHTYGSTAKQHVGEGLERKGRLLQHPPVTQPFIRHILKVGGAERRQATERKARKYRLSAYRISRHSLIESALSSLH